MDSPPYQLPAIPLPSASPYGNRLRGSLPADPPEQPSGNLIALPYQFVSQNRGGGLAQILANSHREVDSTGKRKIWKATLTLLNMWLLGKWLCCHCSVQLLWELTATGTYLVSTKAHRLLFTGFITTGFHQEFPIHGSLQPVFTVPNTIADRVVGKCSTL
jgi:hypothetical protein